MIKGWEKFLNLWSFTKSNRFFIYRGPQELKRYPQDMNHTLLLTYTEKKKLIYPRNEISLNPSLQWKYTMFTPRGCDICQYLHFPVLQKRHIQSILKPSLFKMLNYFRVLKPWRAWKVCPNVYTQKDLSVCFKLSRFCSLK